MIPAGPGSAREVRPGVWAWLKAPELDPNDPKSWEVRVSLKALWANPNAAFLAARDV